MRQRRFTEEQIIEALKEAEAGLPVPELCRKYGISDATFYTWRRKYGGMNVSEARRSRQLEDENRRLKHLVADLTLGVRMLRAVDLGLSTYRYVLWCDVGFYCTG